MGRSAGKFETLEEAVQRLCLAASEVTAKTGSTKLPVSLASGLLGKSKEGNKTLLGEVQLAKDVESHRLKFVGKPAFDPSPFLEPLTREIYQTPVDCAIDPCECPHDPPHVQVRGKRAEVLKLLHALDASGRLALFPPEEVRMQHRAGLFSLMKNLTTDRLILDSRPANLLELPLNAWTQTMASITPILDIILDPSDIIIASGEDLRDYYYFYLVSSQRAARNSLAMELNPTEARSFGCAYSKAKQGCSSYVPALSTMAMGDLNAVEVGQQAHMNLCLQQGVLPGDLLLLRGRHPRGKFAVGVVIDDWIAIEQVPRGFSDPPPSVALADRMVNAYEEVGLRTNEAKRFRAQSKAKFWGASLDGDEGLVRAQLERTVPLAFVTAQVARLGFADRKLLEILGGGWTAVLQCRKRAMCLLDVIFAEIQLWDYGVVFQMTAEAVAELWSLVFLAPCFCTDLRSSMTLN